MTPERCRLAVEAMIRWEVTAIPIDGKWWPDYANSPDEVYEAAGEGAFAEGGYSDPVEALLAVDAVLRAYDGGRLLNP